MSSNVWRPWLLVLLCATATARGQASAPTTEPAAANAVPWHLNLTISTFGLGLGNAEHIDGLRLNVTDARPFVVHGINLTLWTPKKEGAGDVFGLALGLPLTGVKNLWGLGLAFGLSAEQRIGGLTFGAIGVGAGESISGITLAGIGIGTGTSINGFTVAGLGAGAGESLRGLTIAGVGAGVGRNILGVTLAGLGVGAGESIKGLTVAGLGLGAGEGIDGLALTLGGMGTGQNARGLFVSGLGMGVGGWLQGVSIAGIGVGASHLRGFAAAAVVGTQDGKGAVLAPLWFEVPNEGSFSGLSVSAVNRNRGRQRGVSIGIVNYAHQLNGVQIGLLNWAGNNSVFKLLPLVNAHFD